MVCPLRFVLLGASAAVALCGVVFVTHNKVKRSNRQGKVKVRKQVLLTITVTLQGVNIIVLALFSGCNCFL